MHFSSTGFIYPIGYPVSIMIDSLHFFGPSNFILEFMFMIVPVIFCFLIYFKTKESYELTKHEGIKYFRDAFFFFGLSYVFRFLFSIIMLSMFALDIFRPHGPFMPFPILFMGYFSTMGIFSLIFSSIWKKSNPEKMALAGHGTAIALSLISFLTRSHFILLYLQCAFLIVAVMLRFVIDERRRNITQAKVLYILVAALWLVNLFSAGIRRPFSFELDIFSFVFSFVVFIIIFRKVSAWVR